MHSGRHAANGVHALIVDDDERVLRMLAQSLTRAGLRVTTAPGGSAACRLTESEHPDVVLLDLHMDGMSGLATLRVLRAMDADLPILMLTGDGSEARLVECLEMGADDYVLKTAGSAALVARIEAVLRRARRHAASGPKALSYGDLTLDPATRSVRVRERTVQLTRVEYALLERMIENPGLVFTYAELIERVWGPAYVDSSGDLLRTNIYRLRRKLEDDPKHPRLLCSRHAFGYFLAEDGSTSDRAKVEGRPTSKRKAAGRAATGGRPAPAR